MESLILMSAANDSLLVVAKGKRDLNYPVYLGQKENVTSFAYPQMPPGKKKKKGNFSIVTPKWGYIINVLLVFLDFFLFRLFYLRL